MSPRASRPSALWGPLAALGWLAGCGAPLSATPASLSGLQERDLVFALTDVDSLERDSSVGAYRFTLSFSASPTCVQLTGDITATLNGEPMKLAPGGVPDTGVGGREVCERPVATYDFDPARWKVEGTEDLTVVLQDGTHVIRLVLRAAKTKRFFKREGGTAGILRRGQTETYVWQPATDPDPAVLQALLVHKASQAASPLTVQQEGHTAHLPVPSGMVEGVYLLRLSGTAPADVSACEGVARCEGSLFHSEDAEVQVAH